MKLVLFALVASAGAIVLATLILEALATQELDEYDPYAEPFGMGV